MFWKNKRNWERLVDRYYKFSDDGEIHCCEKNELDQLGGFRYLSSAKVSDLSDGKYTEGGWMAAKVAAPYHYGSSDSLGVQGVFNPADGKMYDSKSAYYRAVKDKGLVVVGDDAPKVANKPNVKPINWEKAVAETLKTTPLKGKKR